MNDNPTPLLIIVSNLEFGGAQRQIVELTNNLDAALWDVHIASLSDYVPLRDQLNDNISLHIVLKRARFDFFVVAKLVRLISQHRFAILQSYLFDADISARLASFLSRFHPKVIGSERNTDYSLKKVQLIAYFLTKKMVHLTIANSQAGADFNSRMLGMPQSHYRVIHNGVNTDRFRPRDKASSREKLGLSTGDQVIGVFASFKEQKNHVFLFEVLLEILDRYPSLKVLLVGDMLYGGMHGSDEYFENINRYIDETSLSDHCIKLGNRDDVEEIYPACDFTVLPSLFEGTPNVLLESMACGVPAIATDVSDNHRLIQDQHSGILVNLGDSVALQQALETLLDRPERTVKMGASARKRMEDMFSSAKLAENTASVYTELLPHDK